MLQSDLKCQDNRDSTLIHMKCKFIVSILFSILSVYRTDSNNSDFFAWMYPACK